MRPHLEYADQASYPFLKKDIHHLESRLVKGVRVLTYEERPKALRMQIKKCLGPDPHATIQPNRPGSKSTVQVLQKARAKKIISYTAPRNRKNPKEGQSCMKGSLQLVGTSVPNQRTLTKLHTHILNSYFFATCPFPIVIIINVVVFIDN